MTHKVREELPGVKEWDTGTHEDFYRYYEAQSLKPETLERFRSVREMLLRIHGASHEQALDILDIGCGAGTQAGYWTELGHHYYGIDINAPLIELARRRAAMQALPARFDVGSATQLPQQDASIDICLLPELLEHVVDWPACVAEAVRVLRSGGLLYINTSSKLCPKQQEFNLPLYSWYPQWLKRHFERRAVTDRPELANYAKYPAVNWFSFYGLRDYLVPQGFVCLDRFDLIDPSRLGNLGKLAIGAIQTISPLRFLAQVATPYTLLVARKS